MLSRDERILASFVKTPSGKWKAVMRKLGWPTKCKTFHLQGDAIDRVRRVEDQMVRDLFIERANGDIEN